MTCKGVCDEYRAMELPRIGRYAAGQKRCQTCNVFILWDGYFCPCCHLRLRIRPRSRFDKDRMDTYRRIGRAIKVKI